MVFLLHGGKDGEQLAQRFFTVTESGCRWCGNLPELQEVAMTCDGWQKKSYPGDFRFPCQLS
ncbi:Repressor of malXY [Escherichia coli]|uniref:Repressor of malXY n=1 Tax=Escherichia coli TaxID=562 RepID=A0A2X1KXX1_ECOLX|nr:Repressor of malXY [Escherichia coli]